MNCCETDWCLGYGTTRYGSDYCGSQPSHWQGRTKYAMRPRAPSPSLSWSRMTPPTSARWTRPSKNAPTVVEDILIPRDAPPWARRAESVRRTTLRPNARVRAVDEEDLTREEESDKMAYNMETFPLQLPVHCLDDSQFVTLRIQSGNFIRFQVDTGAQCNVLPLSTYKQATGDVTLSKVTATHTKVTAYGGGTLPVVGTTLLKVWRDKSRYLLDCKLPEDTTTPRPESLPGHENHRIPR